MHVQNITALLFNSHYFYPLPTQLAACSDAFVAVAVLPLRLRLVKGLNVPSNGHVDGGLVDLGIAEDLLNRVESQRKRSRQSSSKRARVMEG